MEQKCEVLYKYNFKCLCKRMFYCILILGCGMVCCWDPYGKGQINALDRVQNIAAKFAHHRNDSNWETLTQRREISRICALFKAYTGERAWKAIGDRL
jgi:hypothetical protein